MTLRLYSDDDAGRESGQETETRPYRDHYGRDYGRVIHSASFRRLQGKTQVFPGHESDFFRNRLTHSLEVAQIAEGIAARLNYEYLDFKDENRINERVCATAALLHDLGHPPFGHNGERALDDQMKKHGGFEGNAQTLRIIARLEKKAVAADGTRLGLDLTYRTLASILKYDKLIPSSRRSDAKMVKGYYRSEADLVKAIKKAVSGSSGSRRKPWKTLECSIMDIADDIAYSTFDLEDAFKAAFVNPLGILSSPDKLLREVADGVSKELAKDGLDPITPETVTAVFLEIFSGLIEAKTTTPTSGPEVLALVVEGYHAANAIAADGQLRTALSSQLVKNAIAAVEVDYNKEFPMLSTARLLGKARLTVEVLKQYIYVATIYSSRVKLPEFRGYEVVKGIFEALAGPKGNLLMPEDVRSLWDEAEDLNAQRRIVCDFVGGMTDRYALEFYGRLHSDTAQSMFKPI